MIKTKLFLTGVLVSTFFSLPVFAQNVFPETMALEDKIAKPEVLIYPNPTPQGIVQMQISFNETHHYIFDGCQVLNLLGKVMPEGSPNNAYLPFRENELINSNDKVFFCEFDFSKYPSGIYFVKMIYHSMYDSNPNLPYLFEQTYRLISR